MGRMIATFLEAMRGIRAENPKWELFLASHRDMIHGFPEGQRNTMFIEREGAVMEPRIKS